MCRHFPVNCLASDFRLQSENHVETTIRTFQYLQIKSLCINLQKQSGLGNIPDQIFQY